MDPAKWFYPRPCAMAKPGGGQWCGAFYATMGQVCYSMGALALIN